MSSLEARLAGIKCGASECRRRLPKHVTARTNPLRFIGHPDFERSHPLLEQDFKLIADCQSVRLDPNFRQTRRQDSAGCCARKESMTARVEKKIEERAGLDGAPGPDTRP